MVGWDVCLSSPLPDHMVPDFESSSPRKKHFLDKHRHLKCYMALKSWNSSSRNPQKIEMLGGPILVTLWDLLAELNFWQQNMDLSVVHFGALRQYWGQSAICEVATWNHECSVAALHAGQMPWPSQSVPDCGRVAEYISNTLKQVEDWWRLMKIERMSKRRNFDSWNRLKCIWKELCVRRM